MYICPHTIPLSLPAKSCCAMCTARLLPFFQNSLRELQAQPCGDLNILTQASTAIGRPDTQLRPGQRGAKIFSYMFGSFRSNSVKDSCERATQYVEWR
jgi:hypothetical protein